MSTLGLSVRSRSSKVYTTAQRVLAIPIDTGAFGVSITSNHITTAGGTTSSGLVTKTFTGNLAATDANVTVSFTTAMNGLATGVYTAVFDVEVLIAPKMLRFLIADYQVLAELPIARSIVTIPFYWVSGTSAELIGLAGDNIGNGEAIRVALTRVFSCVADVDTPETLCTDATAPVSGSWYVGDVVMFPMPAHLGNRGTICTTAGTPGTWNNWGAIL